MKKKLVAILQYVLFLGLGLFLVWWSIQKITPSDWVDINHAIKHARWWVLAPIIACLLLSHYSRAIRWKILMTPLGYRPSLRNTYLAVLIGYLANLAFPRLGEVLKCTTLAKYEKVPADKLVGTIVAERAFDVICLLLLIGITFFTQVNVIGNYFETVLSENFGEKAAFFRSWGILVLLLAATAGLLLLIWFLNKFQHIRLIGKIRAVGINAWKGVTSIQYVKNKGWFIFHSLFIWLMYFLSTYIGMQALKETEHLGVLPSMSALSIGSIAMIITPSGLGAYPAMIQETMLLYQLESGIGLALGWLMWSVQIFQIAIAGFIALILFPIFNKKKTYETGE